MIIIEHRIALNIYDPEMMARCWEYFPPEQVRYIMKTQHEQGRREKTATYQLLLEMMHHNGFQKEFPIIVHGEHGQPLMRNFPMLHLSMSHCRRAVGVALSDEGPVGVDVECRRHVSQGLIERVCCDEERAQIAQSVDPEMEFVRIWTRKEAYVKYLGTGIQDHMQDTEKQASERGLIIESTPIPEADAWLSCCHE